MSLATDPGAPWLFPGQAPGSSAQALVGCPCHHLTAGQGFFEDLDMEGLDMEEGLDFGGILEGLDMEGLDLEGRNFEGLRFEGLGLLRAWDL